MATIRINNQDVEVAEEFKQFYEQTDREEEYANRRYRRYNQSLEASLDKGHDFEDTSTIEEAENREYEYQLLKIAFESLSEKDMYLIEQFFFENRTQADIARELGVSRNTISMRLRVIYKKLKKVLGKLGYKRDFADL